MINEVNAPAICNPCPNGAGKRRGFLLFSFKSLLNALHCGNKFMVKSPAHRGHCLFPGTVCSLLKTIKSVYFHSKMSGLLETAKCKGKVSLTISAWSLEN